MSFNHGTEIVEKETSIQTVISNGSIPVLLGTAPIHLAKEPKVNELVLAYSLEEGAKYLGYCADNEVFTSNRIFEVFASLEGIAPVGFINVLDPTKHKTTVTAKEITLVSGEYTENIHGVMLETLVVKQGGTTLVKNTDYTATFTTEGFVKIVKVTGGAINTNALTLDYNKLDPSKVTTADIIGGIDLATGLKTGMELFEDVKTLFNKRVKGLCIPKFSKDSAVSTALKAKAVKLDCMAYEDIPDNVLYTNAPQKKKDVNITSPNQYVGYGYGTNGSKKYEASLLALALTCRVDTDNGEHPFESPSNKPLYIDGACVMINGIKTPLNLGKTEANYLNENGIFTLRNTNGWVLWGNQTAAFPGSTDAKDTTINWKRQNQHYMAVFNDFFESSVDKPVTRRFIESRVNSFQQFLNSEVNKERILAGKLTFNAKDNNASNLVVGEIEFDLEVTYSPNAQSIKGKIRINVDQILKNLAA